MQKYSTLLILLVLFACAPVSEQEKRPNTILPEEKMVDVITDMHLAEAVVMATPHNGDTNTQRVIDYYGFIYKKHNVTEDVFKTSYNYYTQHPVLLDSVYSEVITRLSDKEVSTRIIKKDTGNVLINNRP